MALLISQARSIGRQNARQWPAATAEILVAMALLVLGWFASILPFFVTSLYRLPVLPVLLFGSAVLLVGVAELALRRPGAALAWAGAFVAAWLLIRIPIVEVDEGLDKRHVIRGAAFLDSGQKDEAEAEFRAALKSNPASAMAHNGLGKLLLASGQIAEAERHFRQALQTQPGDAIPQFNLGLALALGGAWPEAAAAFQKAAELGPEIVETHVHLGIALEQLGRRFEAALAYRRALEISPQNPRAANNLAWLRATAPAEALRDGEEALTLAQGLAAVAPTLNHLDTLAAAYAEAGRFPEAIATAERALSLPEASQGELADQVARRLDAYRHNQPYREQGQ
jgi:Flp pilus assembly protein TadD